MRGLLFGMVTETLRYRLLDSNLRAANLIHLHSFINLICIECCCAPLRSIRLLNTSQISRVKRLKLKHFSMPISNSSILSFLIILTTAIWILLQQLINRDHLVNAFQTPRTLTSLGPLLAFYLSTFIDRLRLAETLRLIPICFIATTVFSYLV